MFFFPQKFWLVVWIIFLSFSICWEYQSQLTTVIFFRGVGQPTTRIGLGHLGCLTRAAGVPTTELSAACTAGVVHRCTMMHRRAYTRACIYNHIYIYIHIHVCHTYINTYIYIYTYIHIYIYIYIYAYTYKYIYIYIHTHTYIYIYIYAHVYTYRYIHLPIYII